MQLLGVEVTQQEFNNLFCEQAKGKELKVLDGKVVAVEKVFTDRQKIERRIEELKALLLESDYKAIKYAEGFICEEEYKEIRAQRQAWREEIGKLEEGLLKQPL